jgi:hypothetical protein
LFGQDVRWCLKFGYVRTSTHGDCPLARLRTYCLVMWERKQSYYVVQNLSPQDNIPPPHGVKGREVHARHRP